MPLMLNLASLKKLSPKDPSANRCGAVAVEFAIIAPVLTAIMFGMVSLNRSFEAQTLLETAAREGARFATMDHTGLTAEGQSSTDKLKSDIKNILASNGVPRESISVAVKDYASPELDFDIDDPNNDLKLFKVDVSVDYSAISFTPVHSDNDFALTGSVVFRNGRATLSD